MRQKIAKRYKKVVFGDNSPRARKYFVKGKTHIICDEKRTVYRLLKKMHGKPFAKIAEVLDRRYGITVGGNEA